VSIVREGRVPDKTLFGRVRVMGELRITETAATPGVLLDSRPRILHPRLMKQVLLASVTLALLAGCSEAPPPALTQESQIKETLAPDPVATLSAGELARALRIVWYEVTLPGSPEDQWKVGPSIEYGDGRKPYAPGSTSPVPGGTLVKLFAQPEGDRMKVTVLGPTFSTHYQMDLPAGWDKGAQFNNDGKVGLEEFLIKGNLGGDGVDSSSTLKQEEYGLRLHLKKIESPST